MIVLISPAKSLNLSPLHVPNATQPRMLGDTGQLVKIMATKSAKKLQSLMDISPELAAENVMRYKNFDLSHSAEQSKAAIYLFDGEVYKSLESNTLEESDLEFAQIHLRILSGLYGLLRPLDAIQPYRLEMGTKLSNRRGKNLYEFWGNRITEWLNEDLRQSGSEICINLASNEYFKAVNQKKLKGRVINVYFKEQRGDTLSFLSFNAKKARGMMARYIIDHRLRVPEDIKGFDHEGFSYSDPHSTENDWLYVR